MNTKLPECWASDPNARGVRIEVSPELTLLLPFDQFLFSELHQTAEGQRLRAIFASHEVTLTGTGLRRIEIALQRLQLSYIACLPPRFHSSATDDQPMIRQIVVDELKDPDCWTTSHSTRSIQPKDPKPTDTEDLQSA